MNDLDRYAPEQAHGIATTMVHKLLSAGFALSVSDGEETTVRKSRDAAAIIDAMGTTDADTITAWGGPMAGDHMRAGSVLLIWENDDDVISDWSWRAGYRNGDAFNSLLANLID